MEIKVLGAESLGVRGLSCYVKIRDRKVVIDPGVALGYKRHGLLPHPFQVATGKVVRKNILQAVELSTDLVISHFHGDHVPLPDANPYQLALDRMVDKLSGQAIWSPDRAKLDGKSLNRHDAFAGAADLPLNDSYRSTEAPFTFSAPMPHGEYGNGLGDVMMTRIEGEEDVFVHASDIQLLEEDPVDQIITWKPDVVLAGGPPLYLPQLSKSSQEAAWRYGLRLSREVPLLILDHHLLRSRGGIRWLRELDQSSENDVCCAADFMDRERAFLEAWRRTLYNEMEVPDGWHKAYSRKQIDTTGYNKWRGWDLTEFLEG